MIPIMILIQTTNKAAHKKDPHTGPSGEAQCNSGVGYSGKQQPEVTINQQVYEFTILI